MNRVYPTHATAGQRKDWGDSAQLFFQTQGFLEIETRGKRLPLQDKA